MLGISELAVISILYGTEEVSEEPVSKASDLATQSLIAGNNEQQTVCPVSEAALNSLKTSPGELEIPLIWLGL